MEKAGLSMKAVKTGDRNDRLYQPTGSHRAKVVY